MTEVQPFVSVIVPCRNEEKFISEVLRNIVEQDYPESRMEVFVVDGESTDRTGSIVNDFISGYKFFQLLINPRKTVPYALNMAIKKSKGEIILRMDAHSIYPSNYISGLVQAVQEHQVDNAGGVWITEPGSNTAMAKAIAIATAHRFGIGNARYRLGADKPVLTDTVPYGCYKREVFNSIGLFDEQLIRNQDDEFNGRLIKNGGKILLVPYIRIRYFARENLSKMSKMFFQYGLFKPLVNTKLGKPATIRQLFPPTLVFILVTTLLASVMNVLFFQWFMIVAISYFSLLIYFSLKLSMIKGNFLQLLLVFPAIHFSYGCGYLLGIWKFVLLKRHKQSSGSHTEITR